MSEKRRDSKNRVLRNGEFQRKDGRYAFKYSDANGETHTIYSWKLEPTDIIPSGKRCIASLRELETPIMQNLRNDIIPSGDMTVLQLVVKYLKQKNGVRPSTKAGYQTVYNIIKNDPFGSRKISHVKMSDAKIWLIQLQKNGRSYSSIHTIRGVVRPAFQMAVDDDILLKNPFNFETASILVNDSVTREAITREEKRKFLGFVKNDKHFSRYYEGIEVLFETGMRISEFVGLTLKDLDMKNHTINIDHQLVRTSKMEYVIQPPKTEAGKRVIPMTDVVYDCFETIIANRQPPQIEPVIQGYSGFLYYDKNGKPMVALHWEKYFQRICEKYNSIYKVQLPTITPHVCRHTYCSHMAKSGMNPKVLQYLMGHSDISVTLNTYTHLKYEDAEEEVNRLASADKGKKEKVTTRHSA